MSTITEPIPTVTHQAHRQGANDTRRRRREFTRAAALGATISALAIGGVWAATSAGGGVHPAAVNGTTSAEIHDGQSSAATDSHSRGVTPAADYQHGASVVALQHELAQLNYYEGPNDGILGPATLAAITNFQRANGLTPDGIAGASTLSKIHQQLITGDSQMWPTAPPVKPGTAASSTTHGQTATTGGASASSAGTGASASQPESGGTAAGRTTASASGTTTATTDATSVAP